MKPFPETEGAFLYHNLIHLLDMGTFFNIIFRLLFTLLILNSGDLAAQIKYEATEVVLNRLQLNGILNDSTNAKAIRLVQIWDSLYPKQKSVIYYMLPGSVWEQILARQYIIAKNNKQEALQLKLAFPLATIYHVQAKSEAIPILEYLYQNKTKLNRAKDSMVLIKLEEQYRNKKDLAKAIVIRNERIEKRYITTFWELYKEAGMYPAALDDFNSFEPIPPSGTIEKVKYANALGNLYYEMRQTENAKKQFRNGLITCQLILQSKIIQAPRIVELANFYQNVLGGNIGMCLMTEEQYKDAIQLLKKDIVFSNLDIDNKLRKTIALGNCYLKLNQLNEAKNYMDTARVYLSGKDDKKIRLQYFELCSNIYKVNGDLQLAFYYLNQYSSLRDTLSVLLQQQQASLLLTNLEIEKRRKNLLQTSLALSNKTRESVNQKAQLKFLILSMFALLIIAGLVFWLYLVKVKSSKSIEAQNSQLKDFSKKIQFQNERNEILLKELHHRVKNNLQLMYSLMGMQKRRNSIPIVSEVFNTMQSRIQSMAFMHDKLYVVGDNEVVDIKSYLDELIKHIKTIFTKEQGEVSFLFEIQNIYLSFEKSILLGLILNEIISNAYKYAFAFIEDGVLIILIKEDDNGNCIVQVKDNGPGYNINQTGDGLGLKIIKTLVAQLDGNYSVTVDQGVQYEITFKMG